MSEWLIDAWRAYLGPRLNWLWEKSWFWQGLALCLLTLALIAYLRRGWLAEKILGPDAKEHDRVVFNKLNTKADENFVDTMVNDEIFTLSTTIARVCQLWEFADDLARIEN